MSDVKWEVNSECVVEDVIRLSLTIDEANPSDVYHIINHLNWVINLNKSIEIAINIDGAGQEQAQSLIRSLRKVAIPATGIRGEFTVNGEEVAKLSESEQWAETLTMMAQYYASLKPDEQKEMDEFHEKHPFV